MNSLFALLAISLLTIQIQNVWGQPPPPPPPTYPTASWIALMANDTLINSDIWDKTPKIFTANYAFEGIKGVPNGDQESYAVAAGGSWEILPSKCVNNSILSTNVATPGAVAQNWGWPTYFADAMPVVFSWPVLSSTANATDFLLTLNNGSKVNPAVASINPNLETNERHVIVVFGDFGNRLDPTDPNALYVTKVEIVDDGTPLTLVGPKGKLFNAVGLTYDASNSLPYGPNAVGPKILVAKLSKMNNNGEGTTAINNVVYPNSCTDLYGSNAQYRLRMYTSGGFTPDGVTGMKPDLYSSYFKVHATLKDNKKKVALTRTNVPYKIKGYGSLTILGLADLGVKQDTYDDCYYDDKDNYIDICIKGDLAAARRITHLEMPIGNKTVDGGTYKGLYNPGGPGNNPAPGVIYTQPSSYINIRVTHALDDPMTVTYIPPSRK